MCCGKNRQQFRAQTPFRAIRPGRSPAPVAPPVPTAPRGPNSPSATRTVAAHPASKMQIRSLQPQAQTPISRPYSSISVRYLEKLPIRVRGVATGVYYAFSGSRPVQLVDARDASTLLTTRFFRRA